MTRKHLLRNGTKKIGITLLIAFASATATIQAQTVQTIRGQVTDAASGEPMAGVTVTLDSIGAKGAITDADGCFHINNVQVGRHTLNAHSIGYEPVVMKELLLSSGKELVLQVKMQECLNVLGEIVVRPRVNKQQPLNEMAQVGARMFSVEEASRYAGGMADPARTASMFAGVATGGATNGISIHGNSPTMLQWRIEGIEVGNPNHFAEISGVGGGVFTALNGTVLANSDFMTGAMPAEYGNALSGVFDMKMRIGNNMRHEHAFQLGTLGIDFASEGPLGKKGSKSSYLINYRYSFLEVAKKMHAINMEKETLDYQDLSFKLNFPTRNAGTFAVWFTGLYDRYANEVPEMSEWETLWDMNDSHAHQAIYAGGVTHSFKFKSGGTLRSSVVMTGNYTKLDQHDYDLQGKLLPSMDGRSNFWNVIADVKHQHKFSARYTMQNGFDYQRFSFNSWLDYIHEVGGAQYRVFDSDGNTGLARFYTSHKVSFTNRLSAVVGANAMWFNLNSQWLVEPRASIAYKTSASSTLAVAYALNSRKENTDAYFVMLNGRNANEDLGLTRSHHISVAFSQRLGDNALLKIEPYWQYLFDVPVEEGSTYSIINNNLFVQDHVLTNAGAGRNYGVDLTLERYLKDGFYSMLTATIFKSEYRDAQGEWHNTRHDRTYISNILGGKEWITGKNRRNIFGINGRFTLMGGERYTPASADADYESVMKRPDKSIPEDGSMPFSEKLGMDFGYAFSVKYTLNRKDLSHQFILEYLNIRTFQGQTYNIKTREIVKKYTSLTFPNLAYRIEF